MEIDFKFPLSPNMGGFFFLNSEVELIFSLKEIAA